MTALTLDRPDHACRLCGATVAQRRLGRERRLGLGQALLRCGVCGGAYLDPPLTPESERAFYGGGLYRRLYPVEYAATAAEVIAGQRLAAVADWRVRRLAPALPMAARVVDVGAGYGCFLGRLHAARPDLRLFACEPDSGVRDAGLEGAPVDFADTVDDLDGDFDLIALFHVLEHVRDPAGLLAALARRLAPGGRLVVEVPDESVLACWSQVHAAHLSYFTPASLRRLLLRAGLVENDVGSPGLRGTLLLEASPGSALGVEPAPDAKGGPPPWGWRDEVKDRLRRLAVAVLGPAAVGRWQRRRAGRHVDALLGAAGALPRGRLLGVPLDRLPMAMVVERCLEAMRRRRPLRLADVNVAKLVDMRHDGQLLADTESADLVCADGMGVVWGARLLGLVIPERVTGIDLMQEVLAACAAEGLRPYLLGAEAAVVDEVVCRLRRRYPALDLAGWHHGYFSGGDEAALVAGIRDSRPDCLIVALGVPKQEHFLARHHAALQVPFVMAVGGAFDVLAGRRRRAPLWMQRCGLEWFGRLVQEPRRLGRRYLVTNTVFAGLLLRAWWRGGSP